MTTPTFCAINGCGQTATHHATLALGANSDHRVSATIPVCERHANQLIDDDNTASDLERTRRLIELMPLDE